MKDNIKNITHFIIKVTIKLTIKIILTNINYNKISANIY
jgi:hypothetical protein